MRARRAFVAGFVVLAGALAAVAQGAVLLLSGARATAGIRAISTRVLPDPMEVAVTSGGAVDVRQLGLGPQCFGFVNTMPTLILRAPAAVAGLRLYVTAPVDTTLLVHSAGRWFCSDDSWGGTNPTVDLPLAFAGQYDVWVGSFRPGDQSRAVLHVTQNAALHP